MLPMREVDGEVWRSLLLGLLKALDRVGAAMRGVGAGERGGLGGGGEGGGLAPLMVRSVSVGGESCLGWGLDGDHPAASRLGVHEACLDR